MTEVASHTLTDVATCLLCGSRERVSLGSVEDTLVQEINRHIPQDVLALAPLRNSLVECRACGLRYLSPRLDSESLTRVYRYWYGYAFGPMSYKDWQEADRRREFRGYHARFLSRVAGRIGNLLDVGAGSGLFLAVARELGWHGVGLELDRAAADEAERRYGVKVCHGTLTDILETGETFDAVTMYDYLEHTESPGADLDAAAALLRPGGVLAIRVPNRRGWQSRLMGLTWLAVISVHLYYFDQALLRRALAERGFDVLLVYAGNFGSLFDLLRRRWRWLLSFVRDRGSRSRRALAMARGAVDVESRGGALAALARGVGRLAHSVAIELVDHGGGWVGAGNNLMVIARKRG